MSNPSTKYVCTNLACESYYDTSFNEFSQDEVVAGANSETCCPKKDCGLPLTPLDHYLEEKKKENTEKRKKLIKNLAIGIVGILIIVAAIFFFTGKKGPEQKTQEPAPVVQQATQPQATSTQTEPAKIEEPVKVNPAPAEPVVKEPVKPKETATISKAPAGTQTKNFADGSRYVGEMKDGKMHGLGTYYYKERQQISPKDLKKRFAEAGDYLIGEFYEGNVVSGKLYDAQNNVKEVVMIGR